MSTKAMLSTSLSWRHIAEIFFWPMHGFLNDAGGLRTRLFSTIFLGIIALPALLARSRYTAIVLVSIFLALGENNPLVVLGTDLLPAPLRLFRFPEKLALPITAALVVLVARFLARSRRAPLWIAVTILPLLWTTWRALPVDWFELYRLEPGPPIRVLYWPTVRVGSEAARVEYRKRVEQRPWMFGAVANLRYGIGRSPDLMHALISRAVFERFMSSNNEMKARYLRLRGCNVPGGLPMAMIVPSIVTARGLTEAVREVESPRFDERRMAVAPANLAGFRPARAVVTRYAEDGQTIRIGVRAAGPTLLMVNQTFFEAWVARAGSRELMTLPLNVDRLGVIVPAGQHEVELTFGRRRVAVIAAWIVSLLLLVASALRGFVQKRDGRAGEVERAPDEDRPDVVAAQRRFQS
jgi:hypothetical protein